MGTTTATSSTGVTGGWRRLRKAPRRGPSSSCRAPTRLLARTRRAGARVSACLASRWRRRARWAWC
eukprot:1457552-Prymnesium_polylepis.1